MNEYTPFELIIMYACASRKECTTYHASSAYNVIACFLFFLFFSTGIGHDLKLVQ